MIDIKTLEELALKLNLTMSEGEYKTLKSEFDIMLHQMDLIDKIEGLNEVEPMIFPFPVTYILRSDEETRNLNKEDVIKNAKEVDEGRVVIEKTEGESFE